MSATTLPADSCCPACGHSFALATLIAGGPRGVPKPGDFSVCIRCGEILEFGLGLVLVVARPGELGTLPAQQRFDLMLASMAIKGRLAQGFGRLMQ